MNRHNYFTFLLLLIIGLQAQAQQVIEREGQVSFFSYTSVENIEASNNQVLSVIDFTNNEIAISMLMKAFTFKKALMQEHFNESYIESDLYPKATFSGYILDYDPSNLDTETKVVEGTLTIHGVSKDVKIPAKIENIDDRIILSGDFELKVNDFEIKIPPILRSNIAKIISITFKFEYRPYEKE